ncbi:MAG: rod shape-determining protein, partial [Coleofasciculaceae cyanobacterium]
RKVNSQSELLAFGSAAKTFLVNQNEEIFLVNGFKHPRSLISDFEAAEIVIKSFLRQALDQKRSIFQSIFPYVIIIHPLDKLEGGLTSVEKRAFAELGYQLGGRGAFIIGKVFRLLSDQEILSITETSKFDEILA